MRKNDERGFSLIEVLLVIAVIMVLAAIAVPNFGPSLRRYEMESSARRIGALMVRARAEAMRLNRRVCTGKATVNGESRYILDLTTTDVDGDPCNNSSTTFESPVTGTRDSYIPLPRGVLVFYSTVLPLPGLPPGYGGSPGTVAPNDRIVFSPRGTLEVWNGSSYSMGTVVQGLMLYRLGPGVAEWDIVQVTVTPYGKTKVFRYGPTASGGWGYGEL